VPLALLAIELGGPLRSGDSTTGAPPALLPLQAPGLGGPSGHPTSASTKPYELTWSSTSFCTTVSWYSRLPARSVARSWKASRSNASSAASVLRGNSA
jgi:hypothetical protein